MRYAIVASLFLLQAAACKHTTAPEPRLDGTYTGTFQRLTGGGGQTSQVSLVFSDGEWTGTGQTPKYPGLCSGTYTVASNKITFTNACIWTADFDWTLILDGAYELNATGNTIEIVKQGPASRDVYRLSK